jgi:hypothetical protein
LEVPTVYSGKRPYRFAKLTWLDNPLRITEPVTFAVEIPKKDIDASIMLLETPDSPGMQAWVQLNGNTICRVGEYSGLDLVGDRPEFLAEKTQVIRIVPIKTFWGYRQFNLRSIMFYTVYL